MLGDGTGKFHKASAYWDATGLGYQWLAAGDFNGDGKLDLAVVRGQKLDMFLGNGDGTFRHSMERPFPGSANGVNIQPGDFNGDGKLDLVTEDQYGDTYLLLGKGDGTFRSPAVALTSFPSSTCGEVRVNDFNHDGRLDLWMICRTPSSQIVVLLGNGNGTFKQPAMYIVNQGSPFTPVAGDFNSDARTDFLVASPGASLPLAILLGNGDGTFQPPVEVPVVNNYLGEGGMFAGDFNGDGLLDLLAIDAYFEGFMYLQQ